MSDSQNKAAPGGSSPSACSDSSPRPNGLKLAEIKPSLHPKFSPNLWLFLRKHPSQRDYSRLWRDKDGTQWIGWIDEGIFLIGTHMMQALCNGGRAETAAWTLNSIGELTEVEGFWPRYMAIGRCAIDPEHQNSYIGDESRFVTSGDHRECAWCGHNQYLRRWNETVERSRWESQNTEIQTRP